MLTSVHVRYVDYNFFNSDVSTEKNNLFEFFRILLYTDVVK